MENTNLLNLPTLLNLLWVLVCAGQVMMMQAGFCLLECGNSRAKNSINVAAKNLIDFCVAGLVFWVFGFGLMFGESWLGIAGASFFCLDGITSSKLLTFFFFQLVFCGTATTIISGAVAERIHLRAYLLVSVLVSGLIYPIFGHWAWGGVIEGTSAGWLAKLGFVDFAGSTVVHSIGGWVALACVLVIGPRIGRFGRNGRPIPGHDLPMMVVGTLLLWFGWFGFNGGSTLAFDNRVPLILVNTVLAGASGGLASICVYYFLNGRLDVQQLSNGILAGLVSITASCNAVTPLQSVVIGVVGGLLCSAFTQLLIKVKIDDVVGAVPTHAVTGVWGTLAVACFADPASWPIPRDRLTQLSIQSLGCFFAFIWAFGISFVLLALLNCVWKLRVTPKQERLGLNIMEHGAGTEVTALLRQMQNHRRDGNFHRLVSVEPFTEVGQIATVYNRVLKSVGLEIAKRKNAEQQFRDIYENAVEGIFQSSLDGCFLSANSSLIRTYGFTSFEEMKDKLASIEQSLYVLPNRRQEFLNLMEQQDVLNDFRSQVYRADGSVIWISETVRCVRDPIGKLKYFEGTVVDITHRMETDRLLYEMAQTQAANKAKTEFLANLSHEIRTPLSGVISMLGLMSDSKSEHERQHYLQIAQQSSTTLLALINDVLDLSKVEAGRMELEANEFNLEALLEETVEMLYYRAREKNLHLVFNLAPEVPICLRGDSMKIKQVIINLVGNAIKFTETGHVRIDVCPSLNPSKDPSKIGHLRFSVSDTGIGIAVDRQQAIFQPFTQADASTTRKYGGTGLGLTISERIVTAMHGSIGVESELGVGSVFSFEIPLEAIETEPISHRNTVTNKRVLLVADTHVESSFIANKLRYFGANATICDPKNLARMLELGRPNQESYQVLLIDGESCDADLALVAKRLQPDAKLILLGSAPDATAFDDQLMKPIRSSALRNAIEKNSNSPFGFNVTKTEASSRSDENELFGSNREILIIDDNDVNRLIASEVVRRIGFIPTAVSSGAEAIEACTNKVFAGVLVDCEMPEMDGHQTTERLRKLHGAGALALPVDMKLVIIALTAQVVAESRLRCLESGMDDYLTKPIDRKIFSEVLLRHLGRVSELQAIPARKSLAESEEPPIRWSEALDRCGGRPDALRQVLKMFSDKGKTQIDKMKSLSEAGNFGELARLAHALRGSAGNLSAYRVSSIAEIIEANSRIEESQAVERSLYQLEAEMDHCVSWIQDKLEEVLC